jgi:hypothetical protein
MMNLDERILKRFNDLLDESNDVLSSVSGYHYGGVIKRVDRRILYKWFVSCQALIIDVFGKENYFFNEMQRLNSGNLDLLSNVNSAIGILESAKREFEIHLTGKIRELVASNILSDFIEQSKELHDKEYYAASIIISSGIVERTLLELCKKHSVELDRKSKSGLSYMNDQLAKIEILYPHLKKDIEKLIIDRNDMAHGKIELATEKKSENALSCARLMIENHLSNQDNLTK